ncbi:PLD nuclease N-terminal domain-containing protein [Jatrophihabitans sp.]|uniref:PLD nuclease N-terminal domain-containing protein n=1 Tax=Jatrophihabitans sp. TaxID=1932789 RepID=UPI0030C781C3|nr:hypothetical protein [Jatrophihabitans sp.]
MLELDGVAGLIMLILWVYCFIDVLLTPDGEQRNLPKLAWVFIVLLLPDLGSIAWLIAGKNWDRVGARQQGKGATTRYPEYDRSGRHVPSNPDDDEVFLAGLRQRAEEQRRRAQEKDKPESGDVDPS